MREDQEPARRDGSGASGLSRRMAAVMRGLVQTVPPHLAACEFDCKERDCDTRRWIGCERRLAAETAATAAQARPRR